MKRPALARSLISFATGWLLWSCGVPAAAASQRGGGAASPAAGFEWQTERPESHGIPAARLDALRDDLAARRTKALFIVHDDHVVYEWYSADHSAARPHGTASMAKAIVGGLALGIALTDGRITLDTVLAEKLVPQWRTDPLKARITVRQLGSHTSGLEDAEAAGKPHAELTGWKGDFWKRQAPPNDPFTLARDAAPVIFSPGTSRQYSNSGIAMMDYAVTAALRDAPERDIRTLLRERVLRPIGAADVEWNCGYGRTFTVDGLPLVGSWGGGNFSARTTARIGRLMLREGNWQGRQLLSAEAVRQITGDAGTPGPGSMGWWNNREGFMPALPRDAFWGAGAGGQVMLVVPSLKLIAVRNGGALGSAAIASLPEKHANDIAIERYFFVPLSEIFGAAARRVGQVSDLPRGGSPTRPTAADQRAVEVSHP